mgnify:CR=1 FL=1
MNSRKVKITVIFLIIILGVFGFMNRQYLKDKGYANENAEIIIKEGDMEKVLNYETIKTLGEVEFTATLDTSDTGPEEQTYTGVPLKNIIEEAGLLLEEGKIVVVRGIDGYTVALSSEEVLDEENVYLAYEINGKPLKSKSQGGSGPYQVIVRKDQFSQRWCKFVVEVEVR